MRHEGYKDKMMQHFKLQNFYLCSLNILKHLWNSPESTSF